MVQLKHFTALQKQAIFNFRDVQTGRGGTKYSAPTPELGQKIIVNQSKAISVIFSIKPFTCQSLRQNYRSREIEWAVFTETAA